MTPNSFISTTEYAKKHKISKMQVNRLIKSKKIIAERVGNNWLIESDMADESQIGMEKTTSLQKWDKFIRTTFHKHLHIEGTKDREIIYARMNSLGLPHERCIAFQMGRFPTKTEFEIAMERLGCPYWISAVPNQEFPNLNRQTKLRLYDLKSGYEFIQKLPDKNNYKIILMQYADDPTFKGTAMTSPQGNGMAEFITGDRHYLMTRGFTMTDPMLFNQEKIIRYSKTITIKMQKNLYRLIRGIYGHMEFQFGRIGNSRKLTIFDYNDEKAYTEIDHVWDDLLNYFKTKKKKQKKYLYGYPASSGKVEGKCVVVHHENFAMFEKVKNGDILISDTTTPEMTIVMKKVKAIITDLGGVTSHAAIVCRELKIPAIVGVGNATEVLRSGDYVKIDADKGEIEIIKQ